MLHNEFHRRRVNKHAPYRAQTRFHFAHICNQFLLQDPGTSDEYKNQRRVPYVWQGNWRSWTRVWVAILSWGNLNWAILHQVYMYRRVVKGHPCSVSLAMLYNVVMGCCSVAATSFAWTQQDVCDMCKKDIPPQHFWMVYSIYDITVVGCHELLLFSETEEVGHRRFDQ